MKILIVGGTSFVGRALADLILQRGHTLTLFHRGKTNAGLFPQAEELLGDRYSELQLLANRRWDAVVDTCGYLPGSVRRLADLLKDSVQRYVFISTISVYANFREPFLDEDAPLGEIDPFQAEGLTLTDVTGETYGPLKVLCERAAEDAFGEKSLFIRPGFIVGPNDPTDRFTYWPRRVAQGGEFLAPGSPNQPLQFIDARDLAEFTLDSIEAGRSGTFNATGPENPVPLQQLLQVCREAAGNDATPVYVDAGFLTEHDVDPNSFHAFFAHPEDTDHAQMHQVSVARAIAAGLRYRPLLETVQDTLAWAQRQPANRPWKIGIDPIREQELIQLWKQSRP